MSPAKHKLLTAPHSKRYFLVPTDRRLEPGVFVVYSLQGKRIDAREGDLVPFEIHAQAARDWLADSLLDFIDDARDFGVEYMDQLKEWAVAEAERREESPPAPDWQHPFFEALRALGH